MRAKDCRQQPNTGTRAINFMDWPDSVRNTETPNRIKSTKPNDKSWYLVDPARTNGQTPINTGGKTGRGDFEKTAKSALLEKEQSKNHRLKNWSQNYQNNHVPQKAHMENLTMIYNLLYAVGEILTMTWPGRVVLGMAVGAILTRLARSWYQWSLSKSTPAKTVIFEQRACLSGSFTHFSFKPMDSKIKKDMIWLGLLVILAIIWAFWPR